MPSMHTLSTTRRVTYVAVLSLVVYYSILSSIAEANSIGIGIGRAPDYTGSDDHRIIPMASFSYDARIGKISSEQIGVKVDLIKSRRIDTGPILKYQTGRSNDLKDSQVARLPEVEGSAEFGWFLGSGIPVRVLGLNSDSILTGKISALTDVGDGHGGSSFSSSVAVVTPINQQLRVITSLGLNFSDENYQQSFFGISDEAAAASGLSAFSAKGGLQSTGLTLIIAKGLNKKWSVTSITSLSKLQGDAAQSPITKRGSTLQLFMGVVFNYQLSQNQQ